MSMINPLYFIANVVYIKYAEKYIFIERQCWNTMITVIWRHSRPAPATLRVFKEKLFDYYLSYMITKQADFADFNKLVSSIQGVELDWSNLGMSSPVVYTEVGLNDSVATADDYYVPNTTHVLNITTPVRELLVNKASKMEELEMIIRSWINLMITQSVETDSLIKLIGFNRCLNILRIIYSGGAFLPHSPWEEAFADLLFEGDYISELLKLGSGESPSARRYGFYCNDCKTINGHKHFRFGMNHKSTANIVRCSDSTTWLDEYGKIQHDKIIHHSTNFIYKGIEDTFYFAEKSQLDVRAIIRNDNKINQLIERRNSKLEEEKKKKVSTLKISLAGKSFSKSPEEIEQEIKEVTIDLDYEDYQQTKVRNNPLVEGLKPLVLVKKQETIVKEYMDNGNSSAFGSSSKKSAFGNNNNSSFGNNSSLDSISTKMKGISFKNGFGK